MMKRTLKILLLLPLVLACAMPLTLGSNGQEDMACLPENTERETGQVVTVIDGDTIEVHMGGADYKVRYIGMDTPEINETYYDDALALNLALVGGRQVTLIRDVSETDQYGRLLRYVLMDNMFINYELVRLGYAASVTFPPDVACADTFREAEVLARGEEKGLWGRSP